MLLKSRHLLLPYAGRMRAWALWRRLDAPGHDACRLDDDGTGWRLHGTAVYGDNGVPARLDYEVACSDTWVTRDGRVHGWLGARAVELAIRRSPAGAWTLNGVAVPGLDECVDLDLGFTPATNALQIRRVALGKGQAMDVPVAWLDVATRKVAIDYRPVHTYTMTNDVQYVEPKARVY